MSKENEILLAHILDCILYIEKYTTCKTQQDFFSSTILQDAVLRRIEIIGEVAKQLPESLKSKNTEIPWKKIGGMRDILIHEYFGVDLKLTWEVVIHELPTLKEQIRTILKQAVSRF